MLIRHHFALATAVAAISAACQPPSPQIAQQRSDIVGADFDDTTSPLAVSVKGLSSGKTLVIHESVGTDQDLVFAKDGTLPFASARASGTAFRVSVATQPTNQTCLVASGEGSIVSATAIAIVCTDNPGTSFLITVTVIGLDAGKSVIVHEASGADADLTISLNTARSFATPRSLGSKYAVAVTTPPYEASCSFDVSAGMVTAAVDLTLTCAATSSGNLEIVAVAPTVTQVTSQTANGTYSVGDTINVQVVFSEGVTVTGVPTLTLETGATDAVASYTSGSGSSTLTFTYTVAQGDENAHLDYVAPGSMSLAAGSIKDADGNNANLSLPAPGSAGSLAGVKSLVVDASPPHQAASLQAVGESTRTRLDWTSGGGGESGYLLVRRAGSAVTWTPTRASTYSIGAIDANHTATYVGSGLAAFDTDLMNGTTYHYALFAYDAAQNYATGKSASGAPAATTYVPRFTQISTGANHACGLTSEGKAWCWGTDTNGQLGNGAAASAAEETPTAVDTGGMSGNKTFVQIIAGNAHTCALTADGKAWCWGWDVNGKLGNGAALTADQTSPSAVDTAGMSGDTVFTQLAAGPTNTCGITAAGKAWCWGSDANGQLGNGAAGAADQASPSEVDTSAMSGDKAFTQIAVHSSGTCALTSEGKAWCWGADTNGRVGNGATLTAAQTSPSAVDTSAMTGATTFAQLALGISHSCGLTTEGKVWCWGLDSSCQLGNGAALTADQDKPVAVDTSTMTGSTVFTQIAAGKIHTCGIVADGKAWCWGSDATARLGNGAALTANQTSPSPVDTSAMTGSTKFLQLSGGNVSTCGLTPENKLWCWGDDSFSQLGNGAATTAVQETPSAVAMSGTSGANGFTQLTTGATHSCGLSTEGYAWCWGSDTNGELGNGSVLTANQAAPSPVDTSAVTGDKAFMQVVAGSHHTCGLTSEGKAWCWGSDANGQLGNGTAATSDQAVPANVDIATMSGEKGFVQLAAGDHHTCGLTAAGAAWCWGDDSHGQLGNGSGTTSPQSSAAAVDTSGMVGDTKFTQLTAAGAHTCSLTAAGAAWCWGADDDGQLGDGAPATDRDRPTAVDVSGVTGEKAFAQIVPGAAHTCALTAQGIAWCWGSDDQGKLGNGAGSTADKLSPSAVNSAAMSGVKSFVQLAAGAHSTCALTVEGVAWCWGSDQSDQLGNGTGTTTDQESPAAIDLAGATGETRLVQLASGDAHACAVTAAGKAWCWGNDADGQLGNGTAVTAAQASPSLVADTAL